MHSKLEPKGELSWQSIFKAQCRQPDAIERSRTELEQAKKDAENKKQCRSPEDVQRGAAAALRRRSSWPEKDRPESAGPTGANTGLSPSCWTAARSRRFGARSRVALSEPSCQRRSSHLDVAATNPFFRGDEPV